jgi:hypothetical protein
MKLTFLGTRGEIEAREIAARLHAIAAERGVEVCGSHMME